MVEVCVVVQDRLRCASTPRVLEQFGHPIRIGESKHEAHTGHLLAPRHQPDARQFLRHTGTRFGLVDEDAYDVANERRCGEYLRANAERREVEVRRFVRVRQREGQTSDVVEVHRGHRTPAVPSTVAVRRSPATPLDSRPWEGSRRSCNRWDQVGTLIATLSPTVGLESASVQDERSSAWIGAGNRVVKRVSPNSCSSTREVAST